MFTARMPRVDHWGDFLKRLELVRYEYGFVRRFCASKEASIKVKPLDGIWIVGNEKVSIEGIQELIRNEDVNNGNDSNGYTALHWAAIKGSISLWLRKWIILGSNNLQFICTGNIKIADFLLNNGADINIEDSSGQTPLQRATAHGKHWISLGFLEDTLDNKFFFIDRTSRYGRVPVTKGRKCKCRTRCW